MVLLLVVSFVVVVILYENAPKYVNPGRFHLRDHVIPGQASYVDGCLGHWHNDDRHSRQGANTIIIIIITMISMAGRGSTQCTLGHNALQWLPFNSGGCLSEMHPSVRAHHHHHHHHNHRHHHRRHRQHHHRHHHFTESLVHLGRVISTFVVSKRHSCHTWVWRPATRSVETVMVTAIIVIISDDGHLVENDSILEDFQKFIHIIVFKVPRGI